MEGIANVLGGLAEFLWPGNWVGMPLAPEAGSKEVVNPQWPVKNFPWVKYSQLDAPLAQETPQDRADVIPCIVGALVAIAIIRGK